MNPTDPLFDLSGQVAVLTGGGGVLVGAMARELGRRGVKVAVGTRSEETAQPVVADILADGGEAMYLPLDVMDQASLTRAARMVLDRWNTMDLLINGAGGNRQDATASPDLRFFDLPEEALRSVMDLNLLGTLLPSQIFGKILAEKKQGSIINLSSIAGLRGNRSGLGAYSATKGAVRLFTKM